MTDYRKKFMKKYLDEIIDSLHKMQADAETFDKIADILLEARKKGSTVFITGNGGSASTASHFTSDLAKGTIVENEARFRVIALTDNIPLMTAWGNDSSYDDIFVEQLKNLMRPGDVVIGISGSGNSPNVLKAVGWARENGAVTIGLSGFKGGKLATAAEVAYVIPLHYMQQIEDLHLLIEHMITSAIREESLHRQGKPSGGC